MKKLLILITLILIVAPTLIACRNDGYVKQKRGGYYRTPPSQPTNSPQN